MIKENEHFVSVVGAKLSILHAHAHTHSRQEAQTSVRATFNIINKLEFYISLHTNQRTVK